MDAALAVKDHAFNKSTAFVLDNKVIYLFSIIIDQEIPEESKVVCFTM